MWVAPKYLIDCLATFRGETVSVFPSAKQFGPVLVCDHARDFDEAGAYRHLLMPVRPTETK